MTDTPSQSTRYPKLLDIIQKTIHYSHTQKAANLQLDSALVEMFYSLPNEADDDDLEDWLHFIVDSLQFAGVRVAYDEIDLDQVGFRWHLRLRGELTRLLAVIGCG